MSLRFVLGPDQEAERVDRALSRLLEGTSRATVQRWIGEGLVLIDGKPCRARDPVRAGSVIEVEPGPPPATTVEPDPTVEFGILYEDEHLIVVDKPAGLVVHPGRGHAKKTLVAGLLTRPGFDRAPYDPRDAEGKLRPGIVHRLDRDTSGVLVAAKDAPTREGLKAQLQRHTVERQYRAVTLGVVPSGTISTLHCRHRTSRVKFTSRTDAGRRAVTHVERREVLAGGRASLCLCRLETGRTHQIRVHLSEQTQTPIFADELYGGWPSDPDLVPIAEALGRQALHAEILGFEHPATRERLTFSSPLPADMRLALERLQALEA